MKLWFSQKYDADPLWFHHKSSPRDNHQQLFTGHQITNSILLGRSSSDGDGDWAEEEYDGPVARVRFHVLQLVQFDRLWQQHHRHHNVISHNIEKQNFEIIEAHIKYHSNLFWNQLSLPSTQHINPPGPHAGIIELHRRDPPPCPCSNVSWLTFKMF